jgi:hypothetical protein
LAIARRADTPRASSWPTTATTKAANANIVTAATFSVAPKAMRSTSVSKAAATGHRKLRRALASVARRHAITGPMPDSSTSTSASGTV